jgi:hypothetical protein
VEGSTLPLATCLCWVGPPSNLGGGDARAVFILVSPFARIYYTHEDGSARALFCEVATQDAGYIFLTNIKRLGFRVKNVG